MSDFPNNDLPKVNYVIATWSGNRRHGNDAHVIDRTFYIREQLKSLKKLKHNLSQITIVVPYNPNEPSYLREYLNNLPAIMDGVSLVVIDRKNKGQSYGSYSHVYGLYHQQFDYYILIEDDYIFIEDYFDNTLITTFENRKNCGFLCSLAKKFDRRKHAAISNGIASAEALEKVWEAHNGILPHGKAKEGYQALPQLLFSWGFLDAGLTIQDLTDEYDAPFNELGKMITYGKGSKLTIHPREGKNLIIPIQFKEKLENDARPRKILILLLYYNRPKMVRNTLESIKNINYDNWELVFIDDGSEEPGRPIVEEILADELQKISFITGDPVEKKIAQGGSRIGEFMNTAIKNSEAELAIILCDDDALLPDYLTELNRWFIGNPHKMYCYSHIILFDPFKEKPDKKFFEKDEILWQGCIQNRYRNRYNKTRPVNPSGSLDSSQVAWRLSCNKKDGIWFHSPQTCSIDAKFYEGLKRHYGQAMFSGFIGQYKGHHIDNLSTREERTRLTKRQHKNKIIFSVQDLGDACPPS